jgi:hypothetical protein
MEEIITKYIENKHKKIIVNNNKILEETIKLKDKLLEDTLIKLEIKDNEVNSLKNIKYKEIGKDSCITN